jgi:hypothetical protein
MANHFEHSRLKPVQRVRRGTISRTSPYYKTRNNMIIIIAGCEIARFGNMNEMTARSLTNRVE